MKKSYNFTLSQTFNDQLDQYADEHDMTRSAVIEAALKEFFTSGKNIQNFNITDLTQRMKDLEEKVASLTPTMIATETHQPPIEPEPIISIDEDHIPNSDPLLNPDEWYRQKDVVEMLPSSMKLNTRKEKVSKAVSQGELETNGKKGKECLIKGSSVSI